MSSIINLSAKQLRRAAAIKEQIQSLENELGRIFGSSTKPVAVAAPKKRRKMSAAGRKAIGDAARKRWALIKAGKTAKAAAASLTPVARKRKPMTAAQKKALSVKMKAAWARRKNAKGS